MTDSAAPGWYHAQGDPPGTERYWDGAAWTEGPRPVGGSMPDTSSGFDTGTTAAAATDMPSMDMPSTEMPTTDMPSMDMPSTEMPTTDMPSSDMPTMDTAGSFSTETPSGFGSPAPSGFGTETPGAMSTPPPGGFGAPAQPPGAFPGAPMAAVGGYYTEESQATTALILSIVGVLCCGPLGIAGIVMGNNEKKAIDEGRRDPANRGKAQAAFIVGIIAVAFTVLGILLFVVSAALGA